MTGLLTVEQKESATAGACYLPSQSTVFLRDPIQLIDTGVGNLIGNLLFRIPCFVQQASELIQVAFQKCPTHLLSKPLYPVQRGNSLALPILAGCFLLAQDLPRIASCPSEKKH